MSSPPATPRSRREMQSVSVREKSSYFGNNLIPTKSAKAIAATLAINVINGGVDAHITGGSVHARQRHGAGADGRGDHRRDRGDRGDRDDGRRRDLVPGLAGNGNLGVGAALALNYIGWDVAPVARPRRRRSTPCSARTSARARPVARAGATSATRR